MKKENIFDYVIIGSGPSGCVLASELAKNNIKIALIDRATNTQNPTNKNSFIFSPYIEKSSYNYSPIFSNQLGGNSALWNCKIYLITKNEFENGDWPFKYGELVKYSKNLAKKFKINHNKINLVTNFKKFKSSRSLREKKLGNMFNFLKIRHNKNIKVIDNSSPIKIICFKKNKIDRIIIKNIKNKKNIELRINKSLILCAGGLGNPNLIQNLFKNYHQNIGKYLCDHPHINLMSVSDQYANKIKKFSKYFFIKNENKEENNLFIKDKNYFGGLQLDYIADPSRVLKRIYLKTQIVFSKKILSFIIKFYNLAYKIISKLLYFFNLKNKFTFEFFFSQKKTKNNHIMLNKKTKDIYGLYKSDISWKLTTADKINYQKLINYINNLFFKSKSTNNKFSENKIFTGLHPSCTTILTKNKNNTCLNKNLRMINYKNVYVCGSSVFNENGFTNPTWTIMTLANRLAAYLKKKN